MQLAAPLPDMIAIDGRNEVVQLADHFAIALAAGVYDDLRRLGPEQQHDKGNGVNDAGSGLGDAPAQQIQIAAPITAPPMSIKRLYLPAKNHGRDVDSRQSLKEHPNRAAFVRLAATDPVDDAPQRYRNNSAFMAELKHMLEIMTGTVFTHKTCLRSSAVLSSGPPYSSKTSIWFLAHS